MKTKLLLTLVSILLLGSCKKEELSLTYTVWNGSIENPMDKKSPKRHLTIEFISETKAIVRLTEYQRRSDVIYKKTDKILTFIGSNIITDDYLLDELTFFITEHTEDTLTLEYAKGVKDYGRLVKLKRTI